MIQSMTGYGKSTAVFKNKKINVEIKSLNSKALDLSTRIAPLYREKEMEIRSMISKVLERGKVDFSIWVEKDERKVNAKSLLGVLSLGIVGGTQIRIIADGADEAAAAEELVRLVETGFND